MVWVCCEVCLELKSHSSVPVTSLRRWGALCGHWFGDRGCSWPWCCLVLALSLLCDKLRNQGGPGNSLLEDAFIPADRLQWVYIFGSPVCTFPWQRPLCPVPPGHISGDKPRQEQMAVVLCLRCGCALPCLPRNPTATNPTFLPAYPWSTFLNSLSMLGVFPDGCLLFFFLFHFCWVDDSRDELK